MLASSNTRIICWRCDFSLYTFSFFVKIQIFIGVWINIRVFDSFLFVHLSVFMPVPSCFYYCSSVKVLCQGWWNLQKILCCRGLEFLFFCIKLIIVLSRSVKNCVVILMGFHWIYRLLLIRLTIYYVDPIYPRARENFPFSAIFHNCFLQSHKVLVKQVFHFFG